MQRKKNPPPFFLKSWFLFLPSSKQWISHLESYLGSYKLSISVISLNMSIKGKISKPIKVGVVAYYPRTQSKFNWWSNGLKTKVRYNIAGPHIPQLSEKVNYLSSEWCKHYFIVVLVRNTQEDWVDYKVIMNQLSDVALDLQTPWSWKSCHLWVIANT